MKREILFRGKRVDNGELVKGGFGEDLDGTYILVPRKNKLFWLVPVDPDSVGQFTGLTDKNGVKIFEGDVVKYSSDEPSQVVFKDQQFGAKSKHDNFPVRVHIMGGVNKWAVIGNIHDNPELL